jgi:hypothetical protein
MRKDFSLIPKCTYYQEIAGGWPDNKKGNLTKRSKYIHGYRRRTMKEAANALHLKESA